VKAAFEGSNKPSDFVKFWEVLVQQRNELIEHETIKTYGGVEA
jgi:hypothetical protein